MRRLRGLIERRPVITYVVVCYAITWSIWFAIPLFAPGPWTLIKILIGIGMGPGLAAVLLDRCRGNAGPVTGKWWTYFAVVFVIAAALNISSLLTGDGQRAPEFAAAAPVPLSALALAGTVLTGVVCGFIFASAAVSRTPALSSIVAWRAKARWWLVAMFLPAVLMLVSLAIAPLIDETSQPARPPELEIVPWAGFVVRSILFTLVVVGIGEETGWRGWMLPELLKRYSPLRSSVVVGLVWGLWHFPLFLNGAYPGGVENIVEYLFTTPLLSILFTWLWLRTGGNLLLAIVLHMALNNSARVLPSTSATSVLLMGVILAMLVTEKMWRRREIEKAG